MADLRRPGTQQTFIDFVTIHGRSSWRVDNEIITYYATRSKKVAQSFD